MKRVLLTGGSGFIGKNILEFYQNRKDIQIDAPSSKELNCINEDVVKQYLEKGKYDVILNFAGYSSVGSKEYKDDSKLLEYNIRMYVNFAKYSHLYSKMLWTGSGAEFDRRCDICNVREEDIVHYPIPSDSYGLEKYCIGQMIEKSKNAYNLRIFGIFGPHEFAERRFLSNMISDAIEKRDYAINQNSRFDFLWIKDFLNILDLFIFCDELKYHTYNITPSCSYELIELVEYVKKASNWNGKITIKKDGYGKEYTSSNKRLLDQFPDIQFTEIEQAIKEFYFWNVEQKDKGAGNGKY